MMHGSMLLATVTMGYQREHSSSSSSSMVLLALLRQSLVRDLMEDRKCDHHYSLISIPKPKFYGCYTYVV